MEGTRRNLFPLQQGNLKASPRCLSYRVACPLGLNRNVSSARLPRLRFADVTPKKIKKERMNVMMYSRSLMLESLRDEGVVGISCGRRETLLTCGKGVLASVATMILYADRSYGSSIGIRGIPRDDLVGPEIPDMIATIFDGYVSSIQDMIGKGFNARLVMYGVTDRMPFGTPGDPSKQYGKNRKFCGQFHPPGINGGDPYDICSGSSLGASDDGVSSAAVGCCRHYAYCVPYDRFPASARDSVSAIVLSSRVAKLPLETIQGILAHELGHAIDFHIFGKQYRLQNRSCDFQSREIEDALRLIDSSVADAEYRADMFADALILSPKKQALCYDSQRLLQTVVHGDNTDCSSTPGLLNHFSHEPLQGRRRVVI